MEAKLKHLEFIQNVIGRMATNSFLFKGWAITIAVGLATFAATSDTRRAILVIALISTLMFWGLDGYYLWLERCFRKLYQETARRAESDIDFAMEPLKDPGSFSSWLRTCVARPHLWFFYGAMMLVEILGIALLKGK